jgi:hypothetical protein
VTLYGNCAGCRLLAANILGYPLPTQLFGEFDGLAKDPGGMRTWTNTNADVDRDHDLEFQLSLVEFYIIWTQ